MPFGGTTSVVAPVLTAVAGNNLSWVWTGPAPSFWLVLPTGDTDPADALDEFNGTDTADGTSANPGDSVYIRGVASDHVTFVTPPSNSVVVLA